ncbi:MAG TPA: cell cycle transcriptional regulator TrcR [Hyphomicrobium sp.]|nr:cell cycle transcriptional regulator TrcR [Hyphomicrobium sp.]
MSDRRPLMPKATAVWLVENTALSFDQIAEFCGLHPLEVKGIADGEVAQGIKGMDPVTNGQLTREEIARAEKDSSHKLHLAESKVQLPPLPQTRKGPRYTPVSRRHDRPNAVLWLLRNHPELKDSQIMRLVGTTKPTIAQIRDRTHWNSAQLTPQDPVTLGLCSQIDLDAEVKKAAKRAEREHKDGDTDHERAGTLLPASETTASTATAEILAPKAAEEAPEETPEQEQARVFAKLKGMTSHKEEETDEDENKDEKKEKDGE